MLAVAISVISVTACYLGSGRRFRFPIFSTLITNLCIPFRYQQMAQHHLHSGLGLSSVKPPFPSTSSNHFPLIFLQLLCLCHLTAVFLFFLSSNFLYWIPSIKTTGVISVFLTRLWSLDVNILLLVHEFFEFSDSLFLLCKNLEKMGYRPSEYLREKADEKGNAQKRSRIMLWDTDHRIMSKSQLHHLQMWYHLEMGSFSDVIKIIPD